MEYTLQNYFSNIKNKSQSMHIIFSIFNAYLHKMKHQQNPFILHICSVTNQKSISEIIYFKIKRLNEFLNKYYSTLISK